MKRMFSEEEIQKIAEAAGGDLTPEEVEEIVQGALQSDPISIALVQDIIYNYLDENPPTKTVHSVSFAKSGSWVIHVSIITASRDKFTQQSFINFFNSLQSGSTLMASGYIVSGASSFTIYSIVKSSAQYFNVYAQGGGSYSFQFSDITNFSDSVYDA